MTDFNAPTPAPIPPTPQGKPGLAVASLVCGIVSLVLFCCGAGIPLGLAAVITGVLAKKKITESGGALGGGGMATAGIILGALGLILSVVLVAFGNVEIGSTDSFS